jgi:hypothetical protein
MGEERGEKIKVVQRHAFVGGGVLVCGVALHHWFFAPGVLAGGIFDCDLAVLHRIVGAWSRGALGTHGPSLLIWAIRV